MSKSVLVANYKLADRTGIGRTERVGNPGRDLWRARYIRTEAVVSEIRLRSEPFTGSAKIDDRKFLKK